VSIKKIIFVFLLGLLAKDVVAQNLLDSLTLSQQKVYKDLNFALSNADSVFALDLSKKKLKVVPEDIKKLPNLQWLKLEKNNLKDIPSWIGDLVNLQYLDLSNNDLVELPASIGKLENVYYLGLNRNLIENLPHEMGLMKNLQVLEMWDNELEAIPEEMKNLHNLQVLELRGILFSNDEQTQIETLLPDTRVMFSPSCNCSN
jgi:Leucine-rich repeat (LRR) protein